MSNDEIIKDLQKAIIDGIPEDAAEKVKEALDASIDYKVILNDGIVKGAEKVGKLYEEGEYFLTDMLMAGDAINLVMGVLKPIMKEKGSETSPGIFLIGTPEGDIHDIGKSLVVSLLTGQGFEVIDLGVDVPPRIFVEEAKKSNPDIIGISGLLTITISKMREIVVDLKNAGIKSKVILGGGILSEETCKKVGADAWTKDGWDGVKKIKELMNDIK